jgi:hypothetical protein
VLCTIIHQVLTSIPAVWNQSFQTALDAKTLAHPVFSVNQENTENPCFYNDFAGAAFVKL